jgi:polyisoprenoid-binding protein YceI
VTHWPRLSALGWALAALLAATPARAAAASATPTPTPTPATAWTTVAASSSIEFTGTLAGGEFTGKFQRFVAVIAFDPANLAGSRFRVEIETGSADTADADRDVALAGDEFFAVSRWPKATYEASQFAAAGPGQYQARGKLTIRGIAREVPVTFTFKPTADGSGAILSGGASVRRLDFGIGQGEWQDTKWLGDGVRIRFELPLRR